MVARRTYAVPTMVAGGVLAVVLVPLAVTGLNGQGSGGSNPTKEAPASTSAQVQANANEVFEPFNGTVRQRDAASVLQAYALNGAMNECMETEGFPEWDWSAVRNISPRTSALGASLLFAEPMGRALSTTLMDTADGARAERDQLAKELTEEEDDAVGECLTRTPQSSDDDADEKATPHSVRELRVQWWDMLESLDSKYGDPKAYDNCLADVDLPGMEEYDLHGPEWPEALSAATPSAEFIPDTATASEASSPQWQALLEAEKRFEEADWGCRGEIYNDHLDEVNEAVNQFATDHSDEIEQARADWERVEIAAAALGFHGQRGSVDQG